MRFCRSMRYIACLGLATSLVLSVAGCDIFSFRHLPTKKMSSSNEARSYILNVAMAQLAFERQPNHLAAAQPYLTKINASAKKQGAKNTKEIQVSVAVFRFTTADNHRLRTVMVPASQTYGFASLQQVVTILADRKPEFNALSTSFVTVTLSPIDLHHAAVADVQGKVNERSEEIQTTAQPLPPREEAKLQLGLARFFMQNKIRDAAYLALENAKNSLAEIVPASEEETAQLQALSHDSMALENNLHKNLPYNF